MNGCSSGYKLTRAVAEFFPGRKIYGSTACFSESNITFKKIYPLELIVDAFKDCSDPNKGTFSATKIDIVQL